MSAAPDEIDDAGHPDAIELSRIGFVALAALSSWLGLWRHVAPFDVIGLGAALAGGYPIFREALGALAARRMTMELSMTLAIAAALAIGEIFTTLVIVLFVLVAEVLEHRTVARGRHAIRDLLDLLPRSALVRRDGRDEEVDAAALRVGDVVIVKPGARLPVDGVVAAGHSMVDQATVTGESLPIEKLPGAIVYAGTINQSGVLEVRTSGVGRDTAFGKIVDAVERAEASRAPIQKTADRLAGYLVYFALACAAFTLAVTHAARPTISVVIVAGACGIAAGTPLAILGAIGRAARLGAIIKGGVHLEALWTVDTIVLDKTGTLTLGKPEVLDLLPAVGAQVEELLAAAATAEKRSEHPLAHAVLKKASEQGVNAADVDSFRYLPGLGLRCTSAGQEILVGSRAFLEQQGVAATLPGPPAGQTELLVALGGRLLGAMHLADVLRSEAIAAVHALRAMGLRTVLLTGDAAAIGEAIGAQLGVDEIGAELLPDDKLARVKALMAAGRKVAMVGDGINDAPALAQAHVGIAMGSGTDIARESAKVVLIGDDLLKLVEALQVARRCRRIIAQNFAGTLIVDGLGVGLAAFGLLNPLFAAFIHVSSELAFILNSTRLLPPLARRSRAALG